MTNQLATKEKIDCVARALAIFGDKWTLLLVRELTRCPQTFSDLETSLGGISPRTLSQRLNKLVEDGIVAKDMYCEHPPRYNYSLTEKGADLQLILKNISSWSNKYETNR
jgi:DNA-binding HxlR family transcriptional regulator